ncbi:MAG: GNAT family N-acetyltransferase [Jatrophihabitantaceae bacterium]
MPNIDTTSRASIAPFVQQPVALRAFRDLFTSLYGLREPVLPLRDVLQWYDGVRRFGAADHELHTIPTAVVGGWFYNTSTPAPTHPAVAEWVAEAHRAGVGQVLIPAVRQAATDSVLDGSGFVGMPWSIEAECAFESGLDAHLRRQLGRDRHDGIRRIVRRVEQRFHARHYFASELRQHPTLIDTVARLHGCNVRKYEHAANFYSAPLLRQLLDSAIGDHLLVCVRYDAENGSPVQTSISLLDRSSRQLYWLAVGIDHDQVSPDVNLFVADYHGVAALALEHGIRTINLGRGNPTQKRRLGANRFHVLQNWVRASSPNATKELARLRVLSTAALDAPPAPRQALAFPGDRLPATREP